MPSILNANCNSLYIHSDVLDLLNRFFVPKHRDLINTDPESIYNHISDVLFPLQLFPANTNMIAEGSLMGEILIFDGNKPGNSASRGRTCRGSRSGR